MPRNSGISPFLVPAIESLIEANKESLIKAATADQASREKLLEINKAITDLKGRDPGLVAAWGLGCGGSCLAAPDELETVFRR